MTLEFVLKRDIFSDEFTIGRLLVNETEFFGYTCEDPDRKLEAGGLKIHGETAIPRGRYRLRVTFSNRFQKPMPQIMDVPQFEGIRIHGGNTAEDTEGCPLLGRTRTASGVMNCADKVKALTLMIDVSEKAGVPCWITVK